MKVLGLCSGRKNGNTEIMMKEVFMAIEAKLPDAECKLVRIQETAINTCTGCESCMVNHLKGIGNSGVFTKTEAIIFILLNS